MDSGADWLLGSALRRLAAGQLGIAVNPSRDDRRVALLSRLRDDDFLPAAEWRQALDLLRKRPQGVEPNPPAALLLTYEARLREKIEQFVKAFFKLRPARRRKSWSKLLARATGFPQLESRLKALEPGLEIEVEEQASQLASAEQLTRYACELFVLRPHARAIRRQAILKFLANDDLAGVTTFYSAVDNPVSVAKWEDAARRLKKQRPDVAALAPEFFEQLSTWSRRRKKRAKAIRLMVRPAVTGKPETQTSWWWLVVVMMVVGAVSRCSVVSPKPQRLPPPSPRPWKDPTVGVDQMMRDLYKNDLPKILDKKPEQLTENERWIIKLLAEETYVKKHGEDAWRFLADPSLRPSGWTSLSNPSSPKVVWPDSPYSPLPPGEGHGEGASLETPAILACRHDIGGARPSAMSQSHLPDDPATWPRDPYQILQVAYGVGRQDLRRAYTRLIRGFKPEHFPEQFRLIRDAYETLLRQVEWHEAATRQSDGESDGDQEQDVQTTWISAVPPGQLFSAKRPTARYPAAAVEVPRHVATLNDELDWLWQRSCDGRQRRAYRRLVELEREHRGHEQICIRLYWLLVIWPKLDADRSPCDWLAQGLAASGFKGPLRELYRREVEQHPAEGVSQRFDELIAMPIEPGTLIDPVRWRWQAAAWLSRWDVIRDDLERLRGRIAVGAETTWAQMLLAAVEHLVWAGPQQRDVLEGCCRQLEDLYHLHRELAPELDRVDFLRTVGAGWHNLNVQGKLPAELLRLVPLSVTRPLSETAMDWSLLLEDMVDSPRSALIVFDHIWQASPPVLAQINDVLKLLAQGGAGSDDDPRHLGMIQPLVREFLEESTRTNYKKLRPLLMEFCLREAISPEQFVLACDSRPVFHLQDGASLAESVSQDIPLQVIYLAHKTYWA